MGGDFRIESFLPFRLNVLAQDVSERLSRIYTARFNLDIPQWRILANLASRGPSTAQLIARLTLSHKSTISRAVQDLEERGLIERKISKNDRRSYLLQLTAEGRRLFRELQPLVLGFEEKLLDSIPESDAKALLRGLSALEVTLKESRGTLT
jgi:DNA-binding MarR family transcriptional regulator